MANCVCFNKNPNRFSFCYPYRRVSREESLRASGIPRQPVSSFGFRLHAAESVTLGSTELPCGQGPGHRLWKWPCSDGQPFLPHSLRNQTRWTVYRRQSNLFVFPKRFSWRQALVKICQNQFMRHFPVLGIWPSYQMQHNPLAKANYDRVTMATFLSLP